MHTGCGRVAVIVARRGTVCGEVGRVPGFPQLSLHPHPLSFCLVPTDSSLLTSIFPFGGCDKGLPREQWKKKNPARNNMAGTLGRVFACDGRARARLCFADRVRRAIRDSRVPGWRILGPSRSPPRPASRQNLARRGARLLPA